MVAIALVADLRAWFTLNSLEVMLAERAEAGTLEASIDSLQLVGSLL